MKPLWFFGLAGNIERGARYEWRTGYARVTVDGIHYPWLTKREAQSAARKAGARAVFFTSLDAARMALATTPSA